MTRNPREHMHPGVASVVPNTPETQAILSGSAIRPLTFGHLLTKLVETGAVGSALGMDLIREETCRLLGIKPEEFDYLLASPETIRPGLQDSWGENLKRRLLREQREAKAAQVTQYFQDKLASDLPDPHTDQLHQMVGEQEAKIRELQELAIQAPSGSRRMAESQFRLDRAELPRLDELRKSRFAVKLTDLLTYLRDDEFLKSGGFQFHREVVDWFIGSLEGHDIWYRPTLAIDFYDGEVEGYPGKPAPYTEEDMQEIADVWLAEADLTLLGEAYVDASRYTEEGMHAEETLTHPLFDIIYISPDERAAFYKAYPLATPPKNFLP